MTLLNHTSVIHNLEQRVQFWIWSLAKKKPQQSHATVLPKKDVVLLRLRSSEAIQRPVSYLLSHIAYGLDHGESINHSIIWVVFICQPGCFADYANPHPADEQGKRKKTASFHDR